MGIVLPDPTHQAVGGVDHVHLGLKPLPVGHNVVHNGEQNLSPNWFQHKIVKPLPYQLPVNIELEDDFRRWKRSSKSLIKRLGSPSSQFTNKYQSLNK